MIGLFDGIGDALEGGRRMIELARDFDPQLRMTRGRVIVNGDPAIGCDELATFCEHQRIDFKGTRFDAARSGKQFSDRFI